MDPVDPSARDFQPERVRDRSWRRPAAMVAVLGLALVAVGLLARAGGFGPIPRESNLIVTARPDAGLVAGPRPMPRNLVCHDLERPACLAVVGAALASLPDDAPEASGASAWRSLLCDSSIDCPPIELQIAEPRGSVVVSFVDGGPDAWLNVVDRPTAGSPPIIEAWIVRWQLAPAVASPTDPAPGGGPARPRLERRRIG